jgi:PQQ-dependent catabolism-associated CXXCW motif protein
MGTGPGFCHAGVMGIARFATASLIFLLCAAGVSRADPLFDPATGLRMSAYRAPVPPTVPGGQVVTDPVRVARLADSGALLIDVMGAAGYRIREDGTWITAEHHQTLPGAIWLPEIGRGRQEPAIAAYMHQALHVCTDGRKDRPIVIFCLSDCWMSWNAVQHVAAAGYSRIFWFPGGTDMWRLMDMPTRRAVPVPFGARHCATRN